jgi:hypothetical protein
MLQHLSPEPVLFFSHHRTSLTNKKPINHGPAAFPGFIPTLIAEHPYSFHEIYERGVPKYILLILLASHSPLPGQREPAVPMNSENPGEYLYNLMLFRAKCVYLGKKQRGTAISDMNHIGIRGSSFSC